MNTYLNSQNALDTVVTALKRIGVLLAKEQVNALSLPIPADDKIEAIVALEDLGIMMRKLQNKFMKDAAPLIF